MYCVLLSDSQLGEATRGDTEEIQKNEVYLLTGPTETDSPHKMRGSMGGMQREPAHPAGGEPRESEAPWTRTFLLGSGWNTQEKI